MQAKGEAPFFGWTYISRRDVRNAEAQMRADLQGVRDELGFLTLHKGYADRFFPGTSVLQTRLRYVFFVPWMYAEIAKKNGKADITTLVKNAEKQIVKRLGATQEGVIGIDSPGMVSNQPPSRVYWSALGTWGFLRQKEDGRYFARSELHRLIAAWKGKAATDDEGNALHDDTEVFLPLPAPPDDWAGDGSLNFILTEDEKKHVRDLWMQQTIPGDARKKALLAILAQANTRGIRWIDHCWDDVLLKKARHEKDVLERARFAASLAAVGRAAYAAMVEKTREKKDGLPTPARHRDHLAHILAQHRDLALQVRLSDVEDDIGPLQGDFRNVVEQTLAWMRSGKADPEPLRVAYCMAEKRRKGNRMRLAEDGLGKTKRQEWDSDQYPLAAPLHYRWPRVRRMLADLYGQL